MYVRYARYVTKSQASTFPPRDSIRRRTSRQPIELSYIPTRIDGLEPRPADEDVPPWHEGRLADLVDEVGHVDLGLGAPDLLDQVGRGVVPVGANAVHRRELQERRDGEATVVELQRLRQDALVGVGGRQSRVVTVGDVATELTADHVQDALVRAAGVHVERVRAQRVSHLHRDLSREDDIVGVSGSFHHTLPEEGALPLGTLGTLLEVVRRGPDRGGGPGAHFPVDTVALELEILELGEIFVYGWYPVLGVVLVIPVSPS